MTQVSPASPVIALEGVKKHFPVTSGLVLRRVLGQIRAVDGVSFEIRRGETYSLVGESGCGKTTTARLILLLEMLTSGRIRFNGNNVDSFGAQGASGVPDLGAGGLPRPVELAESAPKGTLHHRGARHRSQTADQAGGKI